jgi:hypothetical protein
MFHIELRQASNRLHRFNLDEQELREGVLEPWVKGGRVEMGERSWSAETGEIVVLEGAEIPVGRLTMGRGWSVAQREGTDVTQRMLQSVREAVTASALASAQAAVLASGGPALSRQAAGTNLTAGLVAPHDADVLTDALGLELLRALGETPISLLAAWKVAAQRYPQLSLSVSLELVKRALDSLTDAHLVSIAHAGEHTDGDLEGEELEAALRTVEAWSSDSGPDSVWVRRA